MDGRVGHRGLAIAAIMLATAAVGFCPLYALFGFDTTGRRRSVHA